MSFEEELKNMKLCCRHTMKGTEDAYEKTHISKQLVREAKDLAVQKILQLETRTAHATNIKLKCANIIQDVFEKEFERLGL